MRNIHLLRSRCRDQVAQARALVSTKTVLAVILLLIACQGFAQNPVYSAVGDIVSGNTLNARRSAVDQIHEQAMNSVLDKSIKASRRRLFTRWIQRRLVSRAENYITNFQIIREKAEGTSDSIQAKLQLDERLLAKQLRNYGLSSMRQKIPTVLMALGIDGVQNSFWWLQGGSVVPFAGNVSNRLAALPIKVFSSRSAKRTLVADDSLKNRMLASQGSFDVAVLQGWGQAMNASYVVFGLISPDKKSATVNAIESETGKPIGSGKVIFPENIKLAKGETPEIFMQDEIAFRIARMVLTDWNSQAKQEKNIRLVINGFESLKDYKQFKDNLNRLDSIQTYRQESLRNGRMTFEIETESPVNQIAAQLVSENWIGSHFKIENIADRKITLARL